MRSRRAACACAEAATGVRASAARVGNWERASLADCASRQAGALPCVAVSPRPAGGREGRSERLVCRAGPQPCRREPRSESPRSRDGKGEPGRLQRGPAQRPQVWMTLKTRETEME
ncbi:unnamed protein product [Eretmochelys imbricata]